MFVYILKTNVKTRQATNFRITCHQKSYKKTPHLIEKLNLSIFNKQPKKKVEFLLYLLYWRFSALPTVLDNLKLVIFIVYN